MDLCGLRRSPDELPAHLCPPCRNQYTPNQTHSDECPWVEVRGIEPLSRTPPDCRNYNHAQDYGGGVGDFQGRFCNRPHSSVAAPHATVATTKNVARPLGARQSGAYPPGRAVEQHIEARRLVPVVAIAPLPDQFVARLEIHGPHRHGWPDGTNDLLLSHARFDTSEMLHGQHVFA